MPLTDGLFLQRIDNLISTGAMFAIIASIARDVAKTEAQPLLGISLEGSVG